MSTLRHAVTMGYQNAPDCDLGLSPNRTRFRRPNFQLGEIPQLSPGRNPILRILALSYSASYFIVIGYQIEETKKMTQKTYQSKLDRGILSESNQDKREMLVDLLKRAYWMEIETVMSYIANSVNPDGVRAQEVIEALSEDIQEELSHAQRFAHRIKELWGIVPGSSAFEAQQIYLQPPENQIDLIHVIRGVVRAETAAIAYYNEIIEFCEGLDPVTQDMVVDILRDEEGHLRLFEGFLRESEAKLLPAPETATVTS